MDLDRTNTWQRVHTIQDFHDRPRFGVADYDGRPHVYDREWDAAADDFGPRYRLAEIEPELLVPVLEDWQLWLRWLTAFQTGLTTLETHPRLPSDRERHEVLKSEIGGRLEAKRNGTLLKKAEFRWGADICEVLWSDD